MKPENLLVVVVCFVLGIIVIMSSFAQCVECDQRGGVLVRGAFGFECVEPRK